MNDYISREALIKAVEGNPYVTESVKSYVRCTAKNIPAADVVEVVRCGECKYYFGGGLGICEMIKSRLAACQRDVRWNDDFYCAFGERKDGADNG